MAITSVSLLFAFLTGSYIAWLVDPQVRPTGIEVGELMIGIPLVMVFVGALSYFAITLLRRLNRNVETKTAPRLSKIQLEIVTSLQATFARVSILNVQTRRDEPRYWLSFVDEFAGIPFRLWSPTLVWWTVLIIIGAFSLVLGIAAFYPDLGVISSQPQKFHLPVGTRVTRTGGIVGLIGVAGCLLLLIAAGVTAVTLLSQAACTVWPRIFRAHALGFGEDGFMKNWLVAISASTDPAETAEPHHEVRVMGFALHHSLLWRDESVANVVADWMIAEATKREMSNSGLVR